MEALLLKAVGSMLAKYCVQNFVIDEVMVETEVSFANIPEQEKNIDRTVQDNRGSDFIGWPSA